MIVMRRWVLRRWVLAIVAVRHTPTPPLQWYATGNQIGREARAMMNAGNGYSTFWCGAKAGTPTTAPSAARFAPPPA